MRFLIKYALTTLLLANVAHATGYRLTVLPPVKSLGSIKEQVLRGITHDLSRTTFMFIPNYDVAAQVTPTVDDFVDDVSIYSASPDFARQHGGVVINEILAKIPDFFYEVANKFNLYPIIDIRVHDLDLTDIPVGHDIYLAVPGWHADGGFRETYFAKTDLSKVPISLHAVTTVSTHSQGISNTRFLDTAMQLEAVEELPDTSLWTEVHRYIEGLDDYKFSDMRDGDIVMFDARALHKAMPVKTSGKRLFFRMSLYHRPGLGEGHISKQEQLYLLPKPGFQENIIDPVRFMPPDQKVIGTFSGTTTISKLAQEQSIFGATVDEIKRTGGDTAKQLVAQIPPDFAPEGYMPVVDMLIFRLNPDYRPFFPNYSGKPQSVNWHLPHLDLLRELAQPDDFLLGTNDHSVAVTAEGKRYKELWMSVSTHEDGVNVTEFSDGVHLQDGIVLLTSAASPRRELPTKNRGWRLMMRVRLVPEGKVEPSQLITQQYVDPASEETGW